jgi:hypothetical protein
VDIEGERKLKAVVLSSERAWLAILESEWVDLAGVELDPTGLHARPGLAIEFDGVRATT